MKRLFSTGLLTLALAGVASGQSYTNRSTLNAPPQAFPQIDATNFVNLAPFNIIMPGSFEQFDFSDVRTFTNRSSMTCDTGFIFDTAPATSGLRTAALTFGNAGPGVIAVASVTNGITLSLALPYVGFTGELAEFDVPELDIFASNIVNQGTLDVGMAGVVNVGGNNLDLSKGTIHVEGFNEESSALAFASTISNINLLIGTNIIIGGATANTAGVFNVLEGIGLETNVIGPGTFNLSTGIFSPTALVTNVAGVATLLSVAPPTATPFVFQTQLNQLNTLTEVVFINTNLAGVAVDVRSGPNIQWSAVVTNNSGVAVDTNFLYLNDVFGTFQTNFVVTNNFTLSGVPILTPYNYSFSRVPNPFFTNFAPSVIPFDLTVLAPLGNITNAYSALEVNVAATLYQPDAASAAEPLTNLPGRVLISATNMLDLTRTTISGPNYVNLQATNHFVGSSNASIAIPTMDIGLGSTNGMLAISNLVAPTIARLNGIVDAYAARWTNFFTNSINGTNVTFTNTFHVLIVDGELSPTIQPGVLNFLARSTNDIMHTPGNVFISDILSVTNDFSIEAENLTITTNAPGAPNLTGDLILQNINLDWPTSTPILKNLTNSGVITASVNLDFEGIRQPPFYTNTFGEPYLSFVNHGAIESDGITIVANYVEDSGNGISIFQFGSLFFTNTALGSLLDSVSGPVSISAGNALLTNDTILAENGDLSLTANNLTAISHIFQISGALTLAISNSVNDGGSMSSNFWQAGDGINLLTVPSSGDFLGTTVTLTAAPSQEVDDTWSALDRGPTVAGFSNNAAVGHLILDGGNDQSQFAFAGPDGVTNYALYVDLLELRDGATNRSTVGGVQNFTAFDLAPNFKIYYADAIIGNFDISEKLQQGNNGQLIWVPSFAGIFSSTNLVNSAGHTNTFNRALVESADLDSNGNGSANAFDPDPIFTADNVNLSMAATTVGTNKIATVKWNGLAFSTNYLFYRSNLMGTNWTVVSTNIQGPANGVITVNRTNSPGYYRVEVVPPLP